MRAILSCALAAAWLLGSAIGIGPSPAAVMASLCGGPQEACLSVALSGDGVGAWQTVDPDTLEPDGHIDCRFPAGQGTNSCYAPSPVGTTVWYKLTVSTGSTTSESANGPWTTFILGT